MSKSVKRQKEPGGHYKVPGLNRRGWGERVCARNTRQLLAQETQELLAEAQFEEDDLEFCSEVFDYDPLFLYEIGKIDHPGDKEGLKVGFRSKSYDKKKAQKEADRRRTRRWGSNVYPFPYSKPLEAR